MPGEGLARPVPTSPNLRRKPEEWGEAMTERFFHPLDDEITISGKDELVKAILEIDFERGAEGHTSDFRERFTLGEYLLTLASRNCLEYPFAIAKHETPDFVWKRNGLEMGLEVTEITSQRYRRGLAGTAPGETCDPSQFSSTALPGGGWAGDGAEREWVDLLISSVLKKVEDYEQGSAFPMLELLAYSNTPGGCGLEFGDWPETKDILLEERRKRDPDNRIGSVFQGVHVVYGSNLIMHAMEADPKVLEPPPLPFRGWHLRNKETLASQLQEVFP